MLDSRSDEIIEQIREAEVGFGEKLDRHAEMMTNTVRFYLQGMFNTVFWPTLLAVLIGGYIVKYWL